MAETLRPDEFAATDQATGRINVVVETPAKSRGKFKYDDERGVFLLHKLLPLGSEFPYPFGFVPATRSEDGDPLDILVLTDEPLFAGCLTQVRLLGVLEAEQTEDGKTTRNDRLIGAVETALNPVEVHSLDELPPDRLKQLEHFFVSYNEAEGRTFHPLGYRGPDRAHELLEEAGRRNSDGRLRPAHETPAADSNSSPQSSEKSPAPETAKSKGKKAYQLEPNKPLQKGIQRTVRRQLKKALEEARHIGNPRQPADVHDIRKRFKRVRAILRLVKAELGSKAYRRENAALRGAGQVLSDVRNAKVLLESLRSFRDGQDGSARESLDAVEKFLRAKQWGAREELAQNRSALEALQAAIQKSRQRVKKWSLARRDVRPFGQGLKRTLGQAREAFDAVKSDADDLRLHECRKQAKYFFQELQIVELLGPPSLKKLQDAFHEIERQLGVDHDLAMLRREVMACCKSRLAIDGDRLITQIDERRRELQKRALSDARRALALTSEESVAGQLASTSGKSR